MISFNVEVPPTCRIGATRPLHKAPGKTHAEFGEER